MPILELVDLSLRGAAVFGGYFIGWMLIWPRTLGLRGPQAHPAIKIWIAFAVVAFTAYILASSPILFSALVDRFGTDGKLFGLKTPPYFELFVILGAWMYWVYFFNLELGIRLLTGAAFSVYLVLELLPIFVVSPIFQSSLYGIIIAIAMAGFVVTLTLYAIADDLVSTGRAARILITVLTALALYTGYMALPSNMSRPDWAYLLQSMGFVTLSAFGIGFYIYMNNASLGIFQVPPEVAKAKAARILNSSNADPRILKKLEDAMAQELWREEGLTIAKLAATIAEPEYLVRRTINMGLGFRNFPQYLNSFRIAAAKNILRDPGEDDTSVASIAFSLGFGSTVSFTRAFRAAEGLTPSDFRRNLASNP